MEAQDREGLQACDSSEEGRCSDGDYSGEKGCSSGERYVESEWSGFSSIVDENLPDTRFDSDNIANLCLVVFYTQERGIIKYNSCKRGCSINFDYALSSRGKRPSVIVVLLVFFFG